MQGLGRRLEEFKERPVGSRFAALYLDLDRFKVVNDSLGHPVGDELLTAVSRRLESCLRQGDALARLGGDEFAILLNELGDENQANAVAFRIQDALSAPFSIGGREVFTSASIGIAFGGAQYNNPDEIMRDADTALYHAKSRGKARHELFDADMHARELDRVGLENDLRHAVTNNDFEVHYQPIVFLASGMCVGFESLIRWTRNGKPVSPVTFIPLAEELGIIEPLGTWVLQQACSTFADWKRRFPAGGLDYITVNVSSRQLMQQGFLWIVEQAVHNAGLKPSDLRLEITETALMDSPTEAAKLLRELREFGAKIYLDDFGCGYSSLSHLAKLPVDALKIDRSFVKNLLLPDRPAIVESILALARTLKTGVVAEGIEEDGQARELERLGCTHAQGYLFSRPLSTRAVEEILVANQPLGPKKAQPSDPSPDRAELTCTARQSPSSGRNTSPQRLPAQYPAPRSADEVSDLPTRLTVATYAREPSSSTSRSQCPSGRRVRCLVAIMLTWQANERATLSEIRAGTARCVNGSTATRHRRRLPGVACSVLDRAPSSGIISVRRVHAQTAAARSASLRGARCRRRHSRADHQSDSGAGREAWTERRGQGPRAPA